MIISGLGSFLLAADPTGGWGDVVATYGPFAPFAMVLLWIAQLLWKDNKEKDAEIKRLTETAMEKVIPLVVDATKVLQEAIEALRSVKDHQYDDQRLRILMHELVEVLEEHKMDLEAAKPRPRPRKKTT